MFHKGYQMKATSHADLSLSIHHRINELHYRADRLAKAVSESALDSGCSDQTRASYDALGPRQRRAWDMVAEAHAWNAISDEPTQVAKAETAEREGVAYTVEGVWAENHVYVVVLPGEDKYQVASESGYDVAPEDTEDAPATPFVVNPEKPTDAELAAAIERGLATGQLITSQEFLAQVDAEVDAQDAQDGACTVCGSLPVTIHQDGQPDAFRPACGHAKPAGRDTSDRCAICHREAHRPGMLANGNHGHAYVAPSA